VAFSTLEKILLGAVGMDVIAPGTSRKVLEATIARAFPKGATAAPVAGRPVSGMQAFKIGLGPTALAAGYYYTALAAQDQARRDMETYEEPRIPIPLYNPLLGDVPTVAVPEAIVKAVRKPSKFNKAISAGMKSVRSSKFIGKKGTISNSKKAFATVTKTVSALKKGRKRPTKGVRGTIARAVRRYI